MSVESDLAATIAAALGAAAAGPSVVSSDAGSVTQHPLMDLIAAHKYLAGVAAANSRNRGLRFNTLVPDGTVQRRRYRGFGPLWRDV